AGLRSRADPAEPGRARSVAMASSSGDPGCAPPRGPIAARHGRRHAWCVATRSRAIAGSGSTAPGTEVLAWTCVLPILPGTMEQKAKQRIVIGDRVLIAPEVG